MVTANACPRGDEFALVFFAVKQGLIGGWFASAAMRPLEIRLRQGTDTVPELTQIRDIKLNTQVSL
jgi:hypothetical protein